MTAITSVPVSLPVSMRALVLDAPGQPFRDTHLPLPALRPGHVLVRVRASGVNPLDSKIRQGQAAHARQPLPAVLGLDMAGEIAALGEGVSGWQVGDPVFAMSGGVGGLQGSLAEYQLVDAALLARKPAALSFREAAALPLVTITAWEGLHDRARLAAGQRVLVHGGAGGIGHVAIQLARAWGAEVAATGSAEQADVIAALGATPIDYRAERVEDYVQRLTGGAGFDVVLDTLGGATLDASFTAVRRWGGHVVSALGWGSHSLAPLSFRGGSYSGIFTLIPLQTGEGRAHHGEILAEAARLADCGLLRPRLDTQRFDLGSALAAHERVELGRADGKVVVDVD